MQGSDAVSSVPLTRRQIKVADFDQLAAGVFVPVLPGDSRYRLLNGGPGAGRLGVCYIGPDTFKVWGEVTVAELWQWLALVTFLDPCTVPLESVMAHETVTRRCAVRLFQDRVAVAAVLFEAGSIECLERAVDPKRSLIRLSAFRGWAQRVGLPLPANFPESAAGCKSKGPSLPADAAYLRLSNMIPGLLPFSAATLWRKVKAGSFPAPVKLSDAVTAWRRDEVEAWLVARSLPATKRAAPKR